MLRQKTSIGCFVKITYSCQKDVQCIAQPQVTCEQQSKSYYMLFTCLYYSMPFTNSLDHSHSSVGSVVDLRSGGGWFDPRLCKYSFRGLMIVIATGFIPFSLLSLVFDSGCVGKQPVAWERKLGGVLVNPFPNKPWFLHVCITSLLKTLWEKKKLLITSNFLLITSNFSFSPSVFYPFTEHSAIFIKFISVQNFHQSLQTVSISKSLKSVVWERVKKKTNLLDGSNSSSGFEINSQAL